MIYKESLKDYQLSNVIDHNYNQIVDVISKKDVFDKQNINNKEYK